MTKPRKIHTPAELKQFEDNIAELVTLERKRIDNLMKLRMCAMRCRFDPEFFNLHDAYKVGVRGVHGGNYFRLTGEEVVVGTRMSDGAEKVWDARDFPIDLLTEKQINELPQQFLTAMARANAARGVTLNI